MKSSFEPTPLLTRAGSGFVPVVIEDPSPAEPTALRDLPEPPVPDSETSALAQPAPFDPRPLGETVVSLENAIGELREQQREEHRRWLWGALDVSIALAERVLQRELSVDPTALHPLLERALALVEEDQPIEVALPPAGLELLQGEVAEAVDGARDRCGLSLIKDPALLAGEARVTSGASRVDVRLETLLSMLRDEIVPLWHERERGNAEPGAGMDGEVA